MTGWYVVLDELGAPRSEGTEVAEKLPDGWSAVEVDGPSDGRPWDKEACSWGPAPEPKAPNIQGTPSVNVAGVLAARLSASKATTVKELKDSFIAALTALGVPEVQK